MNKEYIWGIIDVLGVPIRDDVNIHIKLRNCGVELESRQYEGFPNFGILDCDFGAQAMFVLTNRSTSKDGKVYILFVSQKDAGSVLSHVRKFSNFYRDEYKKVHGHDAHPSLYEVATELHTEYDSEMYMCSPSGTWSYVDPPKEQGLPNEGSKVA